MCQSSVFLVKGGREEELLRDVIRVEPCPEGVRIEGFFYAPQTVNARIKSIDLLRHRIVLIPTNEAGEDPYCIDGETEGTGRDRS